MMFFPFGLIECSLLITDYCLLSFLTSDFLASVYVARRGGASVELPIRLPIVGNTGLWVVLPIGVVE